MKRSIALACIMISLGGAGLTGCQSVKVASDYDETVDFAGYRTFDWMPEPEGVRHNSQINDIVDNRIKRSIERELEADGYQKNTSGRPDLYVIYHTAVQRTLDRTYIDTWGYGRRGQRRGSGRVVTESYRAGTLIIDLVDAGQKELVWRGTATGAVNDPTRAEKKIFGAVERIFAEFPPADS